ncbi:unnamed protein product [Schistosoma mattheei]|uniref:Reverse transcriptase domain-containing protein n=1 Tax=Schistosoma mattheei TaxID=31246 RepID=A0A183NWE7_9TREM|nr:unnamed protein product [Schistosoma mattheei]
MSQSKLDHLGKPGVVIEIHSKGSIIRIHIASLDKQVYSKMKDSVDTELRDQQTGFREDRSCTDQIVTLQISVEQSFEWNSSLYINFIDYEKAFDSVNRTTLWKLLRYYGLPQKIVNIIRNSYDGLNCKIVHGGQVTDSFEVKTSVSIIDEHSGSDADAKPWISKARAAFLQLKNIWNSNKQLSAQNTSNPLAGHNQQQSTMGVNKPDPSRGRNQI